MGKKEKNGIKVVKQAEWVSVLRSQLNAPEYNPRKIDRGAADKLRKQIREDGLVDTIVVNKRTMNIVGGNQRTEQLDQLYKYIPGESDYQINVQMIDVDERSEVKINTRLNNPDAAGMFDAEKLMQVIQEFEMSPLEDLNLDRATFDYFASESGLGNPLTDLENQILDVKKVTAPPSMTTLEAEDLEKIKEAKREGREKSKEAKESGNSEYIEHDDYILTLVFNSNQEKAAFLQKIGRNAKEKFLKSSLFTDFLKPEYQ